MTQSERSEDPPELVAYEEHQRLKNLSPRTIHRRSLELRRFALWFSQPLVEACLEDLERYMARPRKRPVARITHFSELRTLKAFYAGLFDLGLVASNPAQGLRGRRVPSPRQPISLERVQAILAASVEEDSSTPLAVAKACRDRAVVEFLFATGVRASELCAARVLDVDFEGGSVLVRRAKRGRSRVIPLPDATVARLRQYVDDARPVLLGEGGEDEGALFLNCYGRPVSRLTLGRIVNRVSKRVGAPTHPHVFRRTLATELARLGARLPAIQELLGHAHLTTTATYVRVDVVEMREALEALDRLRPSQREPAPLIQMQCRLFNDWQRPAA